jgi:hypothetical protein
MESHSSDAFRLSSAARVQARTERPLPLTARMKARQSYKIRELAEAIKCAGFVTLDEQTTVKMRQRAPRPTSTRDS